jgi:hypothetical protein
MMDIETLYLAESNLIKAVINCYNDGASALASYWLVKLMLVRQQIKEFYEQTILD